MNMENTTWSFLNTTENVLPLAPFFGKEFSILIPTIWGLIVIAGSIGNGLVIFTLCKNGEMTATNCYVINLAFADLLFIIVVVDVSAVGFAFPSWIFGDSICKFFMYMIYVTLHATCFTLTAMTVDRYYAIVHPVSSMAWRSRRASTIVSLFVWAASFLISMPFAMFHGTAEVEDYGRRTYCKEIWPTEDFGKGSLMVMIFTTYVIPLTVIIVCYYRIVRYIWRRRGNTQNEVETPTFNPLSEDSQVRRRRKVTRMVAIVVLLFATFWFPIHIFNIYRIMNPNHPRTLVLYILKIFAHTLSYANSCVNAFVYAFMNDAFRKAFSKTFPRCCECCPCSRNSSDQYCEVGGMIDQAVQAVPEEEVNSNHMNGDVELKTFKKKENRNFSITNDTSTSLA